MLGQAQKCEVKSVNGIPIISLDNLISNGNTDLSKYILARLKELGWLSYPY
jgi:hypothetical protein